jgi:hypothetical protein
MMAMAVNHPESVQENGGAGYGRYRNRTSVVDRSKIRQMTDVLARDLKEAELIRAYERWSSGSLARACGC